ncbi:MAG: hypothetical protein ISS82_03440 [Nanoarchaeota archaeon]|nr:hypothetical protein [Nanoarchaeota archaeon]
MFTKKILDSTEDGTIEINYKDFKASAPSGTSKGKYEERDYKKSIDEEIKELNRLQKEIEKIEINKFEDFKLIDELTKDLGANSRIALEFAILKSKGGYKFLEGRKLPRPLGNVVGGGAHFKDSKLEFQEFLIIDRESKSFFDSAFKNKKVHRIIYEKLEKLDKGFKGKKTSEGAWCPNLNIEGVLGLLKKVCKKYKLRLGVDVAASQFFKNGKYHYKDKVFNRDEQIDYINRLIKKYELYYVEDPLEENDFKGFSLINKKNCLLVGDDLTVTNTDRVRKALVNNSINGLIIKPNQCGSLIKMKDVIDFSNSCNVVNIISHRSGETLDSTISDLAVGFNIPIIKCGVFGKEREAKINRLIDIEKEIK